MRYSTLEQGMGNSIKRQTEARDEWLKKHPGNSLDRHATYKDEGLSGRGQHLHGALGAFLHAVESGKILPGAILIVENLDRLGRMEPVDQLTLFLRLIQAGITVVTTMDGQEYSRLSLKNDGGGYRLMASIVKMTLAYEESEKKSVRSLDNWKRIRQLKERKLATKRLPGWLRPSADGSRIEKDPERAEIVKKIYRMTAEGWGKDRIAKKLNEDGIVPWGVGRQQGKYWHDSYVSKVLSNPAVIGECQFHRLGFHAEDGKKVRSPIGEPVQNYFPAVVPFALWHKVKAIRETRRQRPGRIGEQARNLFTGLAYCGHTGHTMAFRNKNPLFYLVSTARKFPRGVNPRPWTYEEFEKAVFAFVGRLDPNGLEDPSSEPERAALSERIAALETAVASATAKIDRLVLLGSGGGMDSIPEIQKALMAAREERSLAEKDIADISQATEKLSVNANTTNEALRSIQAIRDRRHDPAFRLRLRDYLAGLLECVIVFLDGEAVFGRNLGIVFNGARGEIGILARNMDSGIRRKRKETNAEFVAKKRGVRAFTLVFRSGITRTVIITTERGKPMTAVATIGQRKSVTRKDGLVRLLTQPREGRNWMSSDEINLQRKDFASEADYLAFVTACCGIFGEPKVSKQVHDDDAQNGSY